MKNNRISVVRRIPFVAVLVLIVIIGVYCWMKFGPQESKGTNLNLQAEPVIAIAEYGDMLYLQNFEEDARLYRMNPAGENKQKLSNDPVSSFAINNDRIYYTNGFFAERGSRSIVIAQLDGKIIKELDTDATRISFVADNRVYYVNEDGIYRMEQDGSNVEQISNLVTQTMAYDGELIYFSTLTEGAEGLYRMELDGKNMVKLYAGEMSMFKLTAGYIVFPDMKEGYSLYSIKLDTLELKPLNYNGQALVASTNAIDISGDKIYFTSDSLEHESFLYEASIDGTSLLKRDKAEATTIKVFGNRVYLYHPSYGGILKSIVLQQT
jgi:outer membrane protein assembly factor BamB